MTQPDRRSPSQPESVVERHLQTLLISVVTAAVLFTASYLYSDNREKGITSAQLQTLTSQVIEMRGDLRAMQNSYTTKEETKELERRLRAVEQQQQVSNPQSRK